MKEIPVTFDCAGDRLVGVITCPATPPSAALLIVVGGPQYRAGSHRQFVQLARHATAQGFAAMRFDVRGMGDSEGAQRSFEEVDDDIACAMDAMQRELPSIRRVGLWGLCGGASAVLLYCLSRRDPRIAGVALVNPWVRSDVTQAMTRVKHYYAQRLLQAEFWKKLLSGQVAASAVAELVKAIRLALGRSAAQAATSQQSVQTLERRMCSGWAGFEGASLLVLSGNDYTAKEFLETVQLDPAWQTQLKRPLLTRVDLPEADHTFSQPDAQKQMEEATAAWLHQLAGAPAH